MSKKTRKRINSLRKKYKEAKQAKVGEECTCPSCGTTFTKTNYQQAFCKSRTGTQCKDYYWNNVDESKRNNTTRISPANARWRAANLPDPEERNIEDEFHPQDTYALGQE